MTQTLHVPENWVMSWWAGDNSAIRMACPSCGNFSLMCHLTKPSNAIRSLECGTCGLAGFEQVQAAMTSWGDRTAQEAEADQKAHAEASKEAHPELQVTGKKRRAA